MFLENTYESNVNCILVIEYVNYITYDRGSKSKSPKFKHTMLNKYTILNTDRTKPGMTGQAIHRYSTDKSIKYRYNVKKWRLYGDNTLSNIYKHI